MAKHFVRAAILASLWAATPAHAEDTAKVALEKIDGPDQTKSSLSLLMIFSMGSGMVWSNALLAALEQPLMYCQPKKPAINGREYLAILRSYLRANPTEADQPLGLALLFALRETYPCTGNN